MSLDTLLLPPNEDQVKIIKHELREDAGRFEHNFKLLKEWVACQPHLPQNLDDNFLRNYLRGSKHDMDVAKRKIQTYLFLKTAIPEVLTTRQFNEQETKILNNVTICPLPKLTDEGYRVTIFGLKSPDPELFDLLVAMQNVWKFFNIRMHNELLFGGDIFVFDAKHFQISHLPKLITNLFRKVIMIGQNGFGGRIRHIHIINAPNYVEKVITFVKLVLTEKLKKRIVIEQGTEALREFLPEKCLPMDYGGSEKSLEELGQKWDEYLQDNLDWFIKLNDIKLIGGIPKDLEKDYSIDDILGVQGSFRKLAID